jgi:hypothetical protein
MTYKEMKAKANRYGETNDCSVLAIALVTGASYEAAHDALTAVGRDWREGTSVEAIGEALERLGFVILRTWTPARLALQAGLQRKRVTTADMGLDPDAWEDIPDMIFYVPGHVAAFKNGKVHDWTNDRTAPILEGWEITRKNALPKPTSVIFL